VLTKISQNDKLIPCLVRALLCVVIFSFFFFLIFNLSIGIYLFQLPSLFTSCVSFTHVNNLLKKLVHNNNLPQKVKVNCFLVGNYHQYTIVVQET